MLNSSNSFSGNKHTWIGIHDTTKEGNFTWIDNSEVDYLNWGKNEPNNYKNRDEDCGELRTNPNDWNDFPCKKKRPYVCKIVRNYDEQENCDSS